MLTVGILSSAPVRPAVPSLPSDASIDVAAHATGATTANEFTGFASPVGSVATSTNWTSPSASLKYLFGDDWKNFIVKSTGEARDVELTTWVANGIVFLRLSDDGDAIFFAHNNGGTNGILEIGVVTGKQEGLGMRSGGDGTYRVLYSNSNLVGTVSGYSKTDTEGDTFTFGASGFDVYAEFNGVEFWRLNSICWPMNRGKVAVQGNTGFGFRNITLDWQAEAALYSYPASNHYDARDFGVIAGATTGSIIAGNNTLTVAADIGFAVGQQVIVAIGGESGAGARGTKGVGGTWPALSYADATARAADSSQASGTYAWQVDTGNVYRWSGGVWTQQTIYYIAKAIPRALVATITGIAGLDLTLDTNATVSATNAEVTIDAHPVLYSALEDTDADVLALAPAVAEFVCPPGTIRSSDAIIVRRAGWTFRGVHRDTSIIESPEGSRSVAIGGVGQDGIRLRDFHLKGNARLDGFGLDFEGGVTETNVAQGTAYPYGAYLEQSDGSSIQFVTATDCFQKGVGLSVCDGSWASDFEIVHTTGLATYLQWQAQAANCTGGGMIRGVITSAKLQAGLEVFACTGTVMQDIDLTNATCARNSANNCDCSGITVTIEAGSQIDETSFSSSNPIWNDNDNIGGSGSVTDGGDLTDFSIIQEGYIDGVSKVLPAIIVNVDNPGVTISAGYIEHPNASLGVATGVNSTALTTIVDDVDVNGINANLSWGEIKLTGSGSIARNCRADTISAPTQENNSAYP